MSSARTRLVIYTVLTGTKEPLGNPLALLPAGAASDLEIGFVCFTDNRALRSDVWELRYIDSVALPSEKLSRRPKALPHEYLADWEYSLYVDNIVSFKRLPQASDLQSDAEGLFKVFKHATRVNPLQEAEAIVHIGYEGAERICAQLDHYARRFPLDTIAPLSTCTVILRQHMHPALVAFGVTWWEQILHFSKRDQMSFDFAVKWTGARLGHLPGLKHDNELIHPTANIQSGRVHANFDAVKYAWAHRADPAASADPRRHYLDKGRHDGRDYATRIELFEFLCHRVGSSLGGQVAPRRQIAATLQDLLQGRRGKPGRLLLLRVNDDGPAAYAPDESQRAEVAICSYLTGWQGTRIEVGSAQLAKGQLAFRPEDGSFDLVMAIGVPGPLLAQAYKLVAAALAPARGALCVLASQRCTTADVARIEADIASRLGVACQSSIHASRHDGLDAPLANSVVALEWARA